MQINGQRESGQDVRTQNVLAVCAVANIVKTSLGPVGLDKVRDCMESGSAAEKFMCESNSRFRLLTDVGR